jgi:hypothetical protein
MPFGWVHSPHALNGFGRSPDRPRPRFVRALGSLSPVIWMVLPRWMYLTSLASRAATEEALGTAVSAGDVGLRGRIEPHPDQGDGVQGLVRVPVTAAVDPVPVGRPRGCGDRCDSGEGGEGPFGPEAVRDQLTRIWAAVIGPTPSR